MFLFEVVFLGRKGGTKIFLDTKGTKFLGHKWHKGFRTQRAQRFLDTKGTKILGPYGKATKELELVIEKLCGSLWSSFVDFVSYISLPDLQSIIYILFGFL